MTTFVDLGGNTLVTENIRVGATGPGQAGVAIDAADLTVLDGATAANSGTGKAVITGTSGALTVAGVLDSSASGVRTKQAVNNVHDTTPTVEDLTASFGAPASLGRGFVGTVDDADGDTNSYLVWASDASFYYLKGTKAVPA